MCNYESWEKENGAFVIHLTLHRNSITREKEKKRISAPPKPHNGEKAFVKLVSNLALCGDSYKCYVPMLVDIAATFPNIF